MTSIYALIDPRNNEVRYIGKTRIGIDRRLQNHVTGRKAVYSSHWIHGLKNAGYMPEAVEIESELSESEWPEAEQFWIAYFKMIGARLTNYTNGGHHIEKAGAKIDKPLSRKEREDRQSYLKWLATLGLTTMQYRVFLYLIGNSKNNIAFIPSQKFLAKELDTTEATISVCVKHLAEKGAIIIRQVNGRKAFEVSRSISERGKAK